MQRRWRSAAARWRSARRRSALCGARRWSWLAPAVGLALLCAACWGTVRLPGRRARRGDRRRAARGRLGGLSLRGGSRAGQRRCARAGRSRLLALLAASLPFVVEGHFGILGTSFNPDMSQHLLATDRLAARPRLPAAPPGLPARPARDRRRPEQGPRDRPGPGLRRAHVAVARPRSADRARRLRAASRRPARRRRRCSSASPTWSPPTSPRAPSRRRCRRSSCSPSSSPCGRRPAAWRDLPLRFVPAALIAVGSVYAYSFPGLIWLSAPPSSGRLRSTSSVGCDRLRVAVGRGPAARSIRAPWGCRADRPAGARLVLLASFLFAFSLRRRSAA